MGVIHVKSAEEWAQLKHSKSTFGSPAAVVVDFSAEVGSCSVVKQQQCQLPRAAKLASWPFWAPPCMPAALQYAHDCVCCFVLRQWCAPCKMIAPVFEQLSNTYTSVKFCKIDVDELQV